MMNEHRSSNDSPAADQPVASHDAPATASGGPRPLTWPLLALVLLTVVTQLASLPYIMGRAAQVPGRTLHSPLYMVIVTVVIASAITIPLAGLGLWLGRGVGLGAPLLTDLLERRPGATEKLRRDAILAVPLGLAFGVVLALMKMAMTPYLPPAYANLEHPGALAGLLGSAGAAVAEETWFRLGLMTVLAWPVARLLGHSEIRPMIAWPANVLAALAFGLVHLPQLANLGGATQTAIVGTLVGNAIVGITFGWLFWRRSLIAAILCHFAVDVVLHVLPAFGT